MSINFQECGSPRMKGIVVHQLICIKWGFFVCVLNPLKGPDLAF
jgi:hypothetical protein